MKPRSKKKVIAILGRHPSATLLGARLSKAGFQVKQFTRSVLSEHFLAWNAEMRTNRWPGFGFQSSENQLGLQLFKAAGASESELVRAIRSHRQPGLATTNGVLPIAASLTEWESEWAWCLGKADVGASGIFEELRSLDEPLTDFWNGLLTGDSGHLKKRKSGASAQRTSGARRRVQLEWTQFRKRTLRRKLGFLSHSGTAQYSDLKRLFMAESGLFGGKIGRYRLSPSLLLSEVEGRLGSVWNRLGVLNSSMQALGVQNGRWTLADFLMLSNLRKGFGQSSSGNCTLEELAFDLASKNGVEIDFETKVENIVASGRSVKGIKVEGERLPLYCNYLFFSGGKREAEYLLNHGIRKFKLGGVKNDPNQKKDKRNGSDSDRSQNLLPLAREEEQNRFFSEEGKSPWKWKLGIESHLNEHLLPQQFLQTFSGLLWTEPGVPVVWIESGTEASGLENQAKEASTKPGSQRVKISAEVELGLRKEEFTVEFQRKMQRRLQFLIGRVFPMLDLRSVEFAGRMAQSDNQGSLKDGALSGIFETPNAVPYYLRRESNLHPPQWLYPKNFAFCGTADEDFIGRFGSFLQSVALYEDVMAFEEN